MAEIILRTADNTHIADIRKVLSCSVEEKLTTEKTLSFEVLLKGDISSVNDKLKYVAEFEGDFYDVTSIKKSLQNGIYQAAFECEHISYRLTDCKLAYFANNGTLKETLTKLLGGTGFSCGDIPDTEVKAFSIPSTSTVRAVVLDLAELFGYEVEFHQYYVSMKKHRGSEEIRPLTDSNVVSVSKTTDCTSAENSYSCTLYQPDNIALGAEDGLSVTRSDGGAKVVLNADEFSMKSADENGNLTDRIYFDPITSDYKFVGNVTIDGGKIDIGGNFKVDEYGNVYMTGDSTIYGGRYYAGTPESIDGYSEMTSRGFDVFNSSGELKLRFGYTTSGEDYPFIQLGSGSGKDADYGLVKKFTDGLWIGNSDPANESGEFRAKQGYNGIFFKFSDNTAYIVRNTTQKNIYTGASIAKFG